MQIFLNPKVFPCGAGSDTPAREEGCQEAAGAGVPVDRHMYLYMRIHIYLYVFICMYISNLELFPCGAGRNSAAREKGRQEAAGAGVPVDRHAPRPCVPHRGVARMTREAYQGSTLPCRDVPPLAVSLSNPLPSPPAECMCALICCVLEQAAIPPRGKRGAKKRLGLVCPSTDTRLGPFDTYKVTVQQVPPPPLQPCAACRALVMSWCTDVERIRHTSDSQGQILALA